MCGKQIKQKQKNKEETNNYSIYNYLNCRSFELKRRYTIEKSIAYCIATEIRLAPFFFLFFRLFYPEFILLSQRSLSLKFNYTNHVYNCIIWLWYGICIDECVYTHTIQRSMIYILQNVHAYSRKLNGSNRVFVNRIEMCMCSSLYIMYLFIFGHILKEENPYSKTIKWKSLLQQKERESFEFLFSFSSSTLSSCFACHLFISHF